MKQILITEPKQISAVDKNRLSKNGILVIEADNPDKVKFINVDENVNADSYLMAALFSLSQESTDSATSKRFVKELNRRLLEKENNLK